MLMLLAARIDRNNQILINARLDGYPAHFHVEPEAVDAWLQLPPLGTENSLTLLQGNWSRFAAPLERLVRRHGNDFVVTAEMLKP
ncbi:hypothetical protein [Pseudogulbenkiania ferrooxidans]|uniref:Uncharacterized protein n=1 Tax=Pseudogulbenkiania ferrooxidans 2002 TaxID=279714 RepID=B9Z3Q4_9NEIS|nr:hypothetical protein [Pseudogulbenkiania ferrooxidans]EEG08481.1 hypothetical protein FuraDRAFT_1989 [Pseudogulbenkiania ferrooxidans 2002]